MSKLDNVRVEIFCRCGVGGVTLTMSESDYVRVEIFCGGGGGNLDNVQFR